MKTLAPACVLLASLCGAMPAHANGFLVYDLSGEGIGRASAVSADVRESAAIWYNPASLAFLGGVGAQIGGVLVTARSEFEHAGTQEETSSERGTYLLPTLFAHGAVSRDVVLGLGVYSAFGIGLRWPENWVGRESAIAASLETLTFNPTVAVRLNRQWSLGAGVSAVRSVVDFQNGLPSIVGGDVRLAGGTWGFGANAAALFRAVPDELHFALTYRSRVRLEYDGRADFSPENADFERALPDQPGSAVITLPDIITAGVMFRPRHDLTLGLDANVVLWSTYDRVDIDFAEAPDRALRPEGQTSFMLRAGADWSVLAEGLHLRGGLIFDRSALPAEGIGPALPDSNRVDLTAGVGLGRGFWKADLGYMLVMFLPVDAEGGREGPEGTYRSLAHLFGLTVGVQF